MLTHRRRAFHSRRGAAMVELALIMVFLLTLLFMILEVGLLMKDYLGINQAAREGVRQATVGATTSTIDARINGAAPTLDMTKMTWTGSWREYHSSSGTWDAGWTTMLDTGFGTDLYNDAPPGAQVRIRVEFDHQLVTGRIMSVLENSSEPGVVKLSSEMIMRRE